MPNPAAPVAPGRNPPPPPKEKVYRGIVVVHGVGEHKKGSYVSGFVEELAKFLSDVPELSGGQVQLTARNRTDTTDTTWATINISNPDPTGKDEEWHVREAWWTRTFEPSKPSRIYLWAVLAGMALIWSAFKQQLLRGLISFLSPLGPLLERLANQVARVPAPGWLRKAGGWVTFWLRLKNWPTERIGRPFDRTRHTQLDGNAQGVWRQHEASWLHSVFDALAWLVFTTLYAVAGVAGIILIGVVYLVLVLPLTLFARGAAAAVLKAMVRIIVFTLGDQEAMTTRQLPLAAAANEVNNALWTMLSEDGLRYRRRKDPDFKGFTSVSVVAHSGGCVVSMAALKSFEFDAFRKAEAKLTDKGNDRFLRPDRINWVTAGSGLNLAWNVRFGDEPADNAQWQTQLDRVNWLNLYARYDPVAQGPAPHLMVETLLGVDPERAVQLPNSSGMASLTPRPTFVALRVANTDTPWGDHGAYWGNHQEVMSRIVHVVADDEFPAVTPAPGRRFGPDNTGFGAKNLKGLDARIEAKVGEIGARRKKVTRIVIFTLLVAVTLAALTLTVGDAIGRRVLENENLEFLQSGDNEKPAETGVSGDETKKEPPNWQTYWAVRTAIGGVVLGFLVLAAFHYARLGKWFIDFIEGVRGRPQKILWGIFAGVVLLGTLVIVPVGLAWLVSR